MALSYYSYKMSAQDEAALHTKPQPHPDLGPFVLKTLLEDVPLSADGDEDDIVINCVEFFGMLL